MARIDFAGEAHETEAKLLRELIGYVVEVVAPTEELPTGERFDAIITEVVKGDWTRGTTLKLRRYTFGEKQGDEYETPVYEVNVY